MMSSCWCDICILNEVLTMVKNQYEIEYVEIVRDPTVYNLTGGWWCAYVTLNGVLADEYPHETFREGNKVGIDTNHAYNMNMTMDEKFEDAKRQIHAVIEAHEARIPPPSFHEQQAAGERRFIELCKLIVCDEIEYTTLKHHLADQMMIHTSAKLVEVYVVNDEVRYLIRR